MYLWCGVLLCGVLGSLCFCRFCSCSDLLVSNFKIWGVQKKVWKSKFLYTTFDPSLDQNPSVLFPFFLLCLIGWFFYISAFQGPTEKEQIDIQGDIIYDIVAFITATWPDVTYNLSPFCLFFSASTRMNNDCLKTHDCCISLFSRYLKNPFSSLKMGRRFRVVDDLTFVRGFWHGTFM